MLVQISKALRDSTFGEVGGTGTGDPAHGTQPGCDQAAIRQLANPDGQIHLVFNQIDNVIRKSQAHVDFGKVIEKVEHDRLNVQPPEHDWRRDQQVSARRAVFTRGSALGLIEFVQHTPASGHEGVAHIGQYKLATGAHDKLRTKVSLKV
ncbi:hypothetical protein GCM10009127_00470 [Alteraurantiacibacter aestuarii]